jgi:hypothetical protein
MAVRHDKNGRHHRDSPERLVGERGPRSSGATEPNLQKHPERQPTALAVENCLSKTDSRASELTGRAIIEYTGALCRTLP